MIVGEAKLVMNGVLRLEGVVAQWCNPLTLQPEQSGDWVRNR